MNSLTKPDLNSILTILENPTRRDIIKRLSEEPNYTLQLAKDLGLGQQLVAKHLKIMEDAGFVTSSIESSPQGPNRRTYILNKSISVTLDFASHLFKAKVVYFNNEPEKEEISETYATLFHRVRETLEKQKEYDRLTPFTKIISDIDTKLEALENERSILLYIRNVVMKEASCLIETFENSDTRRILYHSLDERDVSVKSISESLNLRESVVRQLLLKLKKNFKVGVGTVE